MSKKPQSGDPVKSSRYEYRVWGRYRKACRKLRKIGSEELRESFQDCYLLIDDPAWNAKVRNDTLKVKQLIEEDKGFERWASGKYRSANEAPSPFDVLYDELNLDRARSKKSFDLSKAVDRLDPELGVRAVFVTKHRSRYRVGGLRAEITDIVIDETDETYRSLAIEGNDLAELVALRKQLGLRGEPNTPMHRAIHAEVED